MITIHRPAVIAGVTALLFALAGCASPTSAEPSTATIAAPAFQTAACNLGEQLDGDVIRARYAAPTVDASLLEEYGPTVANDSCSDSQILHWQQLRRTLGESDRICRIVYNYDDVMALVYPIGCAVPVVVSADATR